MYFELAHSLQELFDVAVTLLQFLHLFTPRESGTLIRIYKVLFSSSVAVVTKLQGKASIFLILCLSTECWKLHLKDFK
jgi:hypothetical protein